MRSEEFREEQVSQSIKPKGDVQRQARSETPSFILYPENTVLIRRGSSAELLFWRFAASPWCSHLWRMALESFVCPREVAAGRRRNTKRSRVQSLELKGVVQCRLL